MASTNEGSAKQEEVEINGRPLTKLKVDELKQELISRGLDKSGLKKELQERLIKAIKKEQRNANGSTANAPEPETSSHNDEEIASQEVSSTTIDDDEHIASTVGSNMESSSGKLDENNDASTSGKGNESVMTDLPKDLLEVDSVSDVTKDLQENENKATNESDATEDLKKTANNPESVDDGEIDEEEKKEDQKPSVGEKRRKISLTRQISNNPPAPGTRKRKWSSNKSKSSVVISTDSLKELIPGVQLASTPALEAVMELDDDRDEESETKDEKDEKEARSMDEKSPFKKRIVQIAESKTVKLSGSFKNGEMGNMENDISSKRADLLGFTLWLCELLA